MSLFSIFYYFLLSIVYILALPFLFYKSRNIKYKQSIPAKFFLKNNPAFGENGIWFHSCSLGESKNIQPLVQMFENSKVSVITNTGFKEVKKFCNEVAYLPFEIFLPFWIKKQKVLVVMEAELWYMLFLCAKKKGAKTFLINARISDKSYKSYKRFSFLYKRIFENIDKVFAQSKIDKQRLQELGAKNIEIIGNIKLAKQPEIKLHLQKPKTKVFCAASTHKNEEQLILDSFDKSFGKLLIVPRHPERFDEVDEIIKKHIEGKDITYSRYSYKSNFDCDIILIDKMGILNDIYSISDIVILGGAFEEIGGHNPIEPAYFSCKLISGKNIFNQKELFKYVENYRLIKKEGLREVLQNIEKLKKAEIKHSSSFEPIIKEIKKWQ